MPRMHRRKSQTTAPHPLAAAIRAEADKEPPADPRPQSIPAAVWSVLRGLRNRGYSVQQISTFLSRHGYRIDPDTLAARLRPRAPRPAPSPPTAAPAPSSHAGAVSGPVRTPPEGPSATPVSPDADAAPPTARTAAVPTSLPAGGRVTDGQRTQYQIPAWADGTDLRPGETLERYARRKRVAGPPPDRSKFIGES